MQICSSIVIFISGNESIYINPWHGRVPWKCDFGQVRSAPDMCGFVQDNGRDHFDWWPNVNATPTAGTGPPEQHFIRQSKKDNIKSCIIFCAHVLYPRHYRCVYVHGSDVSGIRCDGPFNIAHILSNGFNMALPHLQLQYVRTGYGNSEGCKCTGRNHLVTNRRLTFLLSSNTPSPPP